MTGPSKNSRYIGEKQLGDIDGGVIVTNYNSAMDSAKVRRHCEKHGEERFTRIQKVEKIWTNVKLENRNINMEKRCNLRKS